jgi:Protein of unknown function (DUF3102)
MLMKTELSATELEQSARRIKMLRHAATEHAVEIGRELLRVKESLPHGSFAKWVEKACEFKIRTAQDLMKLAREADSNTKLVALMVPSTLRLYLSKTTPPAVRNSILKRLENGDRISRSKLQSELVDPSLKSATMTSGRGIPDGARATFNLLGSGGGLAELEGDRSRTVAELLISRLSRKDYELIMDGVNWEIWNRVLVWMKAARVVDPERVELVHPRARVVSSIGQMASKLQ